ncbi:unnamed protein product [Anisakis simplex]|uniref:BTB domain-containing protein n=1 Tax=Anisakis simplex TaxID=6269 RepID=A0A0M3K6M2_ANISI|nr:unnamed protein product [Anisakis simplex]
MPHHEFEEFSIEFRGHSYDLKGSEFRNIMTQLRDPDSKFVGGWATFSLELTFAADEFINPKPNYILPEIPSNLPADDYRNVMVARTSQISDFTIETSNGTIQAVRLLLILSTRYFRDFINLNPTANTAILPFSKFVVDEVLKFALTGSFDLLGSQVDVLDEFLSCTELIVPTDTHSLTEHIAVNLRRRLQEWQTLPLYDCLKLLVLSCKHGLWELSCTLTNLIANVHYKVFKRDYNAHSTGQNLRIFEELNEQTFRFIHPIDNIKRKFEQSEKMRPILRFRAISKTNEI